LMSWTRPVFSSGKTVNRRRKRCCGSASIDSPSDIPSCRACRCGKRRRKRVSAPASRFSRWRDMTAKTSPRRFCLLLFAFLVADTARAELPSETANGFSVETLGAPSKHWVWINDVVFQHGTDGSALLVDADSGHYLGSLSTGFGFLHVLLPQDGKYIYSP